MLRVGLVGTGGMVPLPNRFLSSMIMSCNGKMILVDCGEGTQISLKKLGWGLKNIDIICFTHFHADHIAGLPGLAPLTLIGPKWLNLIVQSLTIIVPSLPFELKYIELDENNVLNYTEGLFTINTLWVEHHMPCLAYNFEIKRKPRFDREKALSNKVPMCLWIKLQKEDNILFENNHYTQEMVLGEDRKGLKISYCTDSRPVTNLINFIKDSDLFICEGMYGDNSLLEKASLKKHMLFSEAAQLAKTSNVHELWLTHFSPSVVIPENYIDNASNIFSNTIIGYDGMWKEFSFE